MVESHKVPDLIGAGSGHKVDHSSLFKSSTLKGIPFFAKEDVERAKK
jgi:hypothetical protein